MRTAQSGIALSSEQQAVVDHRDGHLQVIACAGAGKTEAISRRVTSLIEEGVEPSQIVAFTFTERAASSLKNRITKRIASAKGEAYLDRLGPMFIGTIHAYCLRMLQDHVPEFGNFDLLDDNRLAGLLSREYRRLELSKLGNQHWKPITQFLRNADVMENELLDPAPLKGTPFGDCYLAFKAMLYRYHFLTYGLLISAAVKALNDPVVRSKVHGQLRHLIVDEYQDVNPAQEKLIALLTQPPVQLCVVADDDQSIYQWRGSDVSHMIEFSHRYQAKSLTLSVNRRSRPSIIQTANVFALSITPRLSKKMECFRPTGQHEVHCWSAEKAEDEAESIASTIEKLHERGYRYKDIAVLYRSVRTSSPPLIEKLEAKGIPYRCNGRTGLFQQPEAIVLGQTYAWLTDNDWKSDRYGSSAPVDFEQLLVDFQTLFSQGQFIPGLREYLNDWKEQVSNTATTVNFVRDYYKLLRGLSVHQIDIDKPDGSVTMGCLARFSQILADFEHVNRRSRFVEEAGQQVFRSGQDRGVWYYRQLYNYLQFYALDKYEDFEGEETFDLDAVDIMTIHQSKGLEWPVVFIPSLVEGRFPSKYAGTSGDWLIDESVFTPAMRQRYEGSEAEERRLFYVAVTRARDMTYLSRFQRKQNRFKPSPFLVEVAGRDPALIAPGDTLPLPDAYTPAADEREELPTVSFSELAHYEECPQRYRFSTSFGFQPQLVTELGYGRAIHHILRHIGELAKTKKRVPTKDEVDSIIRNGFYLPFANHAAYESLLGRAKAIVDKYLNEHSSDLLRIWQTERSFELHLEKGIVNGRADVILDMENGKIGRLAIVDYKTANDGKSDDIFSFQLSIYAAAGTGEGLNVEAAYLHSLKEGKRIPIPVDRVKQRVSRVRADALMESIVAGDFPARPGAAKCKACDMRAICKDALCSKYDF